MNDHEELRRDPLLAVLVEKEDLTGKDRRRVRDQGTALAGKSTLNRMELGAAKLGEKERYKKITLDEAAVDRTLVDIFLQARGGRKRVLHRLLGKRRARARLLAFVLVMCSRAAES